MFEHLEVMDLHELNEFEYLWAISLFFYVYNSDMDKMDQENLNDFQRKIVGESPEIQNLEEALTHSSNKGDEPLKTNSQRELAYLGDSILYYWVTRKLLDQFPNAKRSEIDKNRQRLINNHHLKEVGDALEISDVINLGGSRRGKELSVRMTATAVEAIIGAIAKENEVAAKTFIEKFVID